MIIQVSGRLQDMADIDRKPGACNTCGVEEAALKHAALQTVLHQR